MKPTPAQIEAILADYLGPVQSQFAAARILTVAAEVGRPDRTQEYHDRAQEFYANWKSALHRLERIEATTIERCAQVADRWQGWDARNIAAAIRALKNKP